MVQMICCFYLTCFCFNFVGVCCLKNWIRGSFMCSAMQISPCFVDRTASFELSISNYPLIYIVRFTNFKLKTVCISTTLSLSWLVSLYKLITWAKIFLSLSCIHLMCCNSMQKKESISWLLYGSLLKHFCLLKCKILILLIWF